MSQTASPTTPQTILEQDDRLLEIRDVCRRMGFDPTNRTYYDMVRTMILVAGIGIRIPPYKKKLFVRETDLRNFLDTLQPVGSSRKRKRGAVINASRKVVLIDEDEMPMATITTG
jgi:hypothetical protein